MKNVRNFLFAARFRVTLVEYFLLAALLWVVVSVAARLLRVGL